MEDRGTRFLACIVGMNEEGVIGLQGKMPWREPKDLAHFKNVTMGHALIMGHRTHLSIGRPLPGRRNLVLSRQADLCIEGCEVFSSLEAALEAAYLEDDCPFVIGGGELYREALPRFTHLFVTWIPYFGEGDTFFPAWEKEAWSVSHAREERGESGVLRFVEYRRDPS